MSRVILLGLFLYTCADLSGYRRVPTSLPNPHRRTVPRRTIPSRCTPSRGPGLSPERDRVEERRRKLLEVYPADAMPMEVLRGESDQIASRLAAINERLTAGDIRYETVQATLTTALPLARDCYGMYRTAEDTVWRQMYQAFIERIEIAIYDDEITVEPHPAAPFDTLFVMSDEPSNDEQPPTGMQPVRVPKTMFWWI